MKRHVCGSPICAGTEVWVSFYPENAPYALPRTIDHGTYMTRKEGPGKATLRALASGEMQTATQNINPEG